MVGDSPLEQARHTFGQHSHHVAHVVERFLQDGLVMLTLLPFQRGKLDRGCIKKLSGPFYLLFGFRSTKLRQGQHFPYAVGMIGKMDGEESKDFLVVPHHHFVAQHQVFELLGF